MTDHDDPFERELRALLRDRAAGPVPASLRASADAVGRDHAAGRNAGARRRSIGGLLVAAAAVLLLGTAINPVSTWIEAMVPAGATAPSDRYDLGSTMTRLTADGVQLTAGGRPIPVPEQVAGDGDPGGQRYRSLELAWLAGGRQQRLHLYFDADATHWWVSEARIYDDRDDPQWITFRGPLAQTPIGEAFRGDIAIESTEGRVPGTVHMTGVTLDPDGLGTGPTSWDGCVPWDRLSAEQRAPYLAATEPARIGALATAGDLCVVYRWTFPVDTGELVGETWCAPPTAGTVSDTGPGPGGALLVSVRDATVRTPRTQPLQGWGCGPDAPTDAAIPVDGATGPDAGPPQPVTTDTANPPTPATSEDP